MVSSELGMMANSSQFLLFFCVCLLLLCDVVCWPHPKTAYDVEKILVPTLKIAK
jgi:predicted small integral membrane protein